MVTLSWYSILSLIISYSLLECVDCMYVLTPHASHQCYDMLMMHTYSYLSSQHVICRQGWWEFPPFCFSHPSLWSVSSHPSVPWSVSSIPGGDRVYPYFWYVCVYVHSQNRYPEQPIHYFCNVFFLLMLMNRPSPITVLTARWFLCLFEIGQPTLESEARASSPGSRSVPTSSKVARW